MAAASTTPSASSIDLEALIQSLPACRRCRDCRRGCDTLLPKCRQCSKAGVDCIFWDHGKNEYMPRSYIAELVDHVRRLTGCSPRLGHPSPAATATVSADTPRTLPSASSTANPESVASDQQPHYDHHFAYAGGSYRYLGAESCLVKSPRLQQAEVRTPVVDSDVWELVRSTHQNYDLIVTYFQVIQPLYPILDTTMRFLSPDVPTDLTPTEIFCLNMVYSIACYQQPSANGKKDPKYHWQSSGKLDFHHLASEKYRVLAEQFFNRAMEHLEASTVEPTISTLRAILLLAINSLFDPKSGNIGQQVALATRLALNLEATHEIQEVSPEDSEMLHNMHSTIFSIENEIASTLDRPATFPEPEWPIQFDKNYTADFLCSLYRLQHRFRKGDHSVLKLLPGFDDRSQLHPSLRMALHQTHLLLNPCWGTAWHVLEAVVSSGAIHIFLTPHWVYRAGCLLLENVDKIWEVSLIQLYSNALVILELSSSKWPNTGVLRDSLVELLQHMKMKHRPHWENANIQLADVRL